MRDDNRMGIGYNGASYGRTVNIGGDRYKLLPGERSGFWRRYLSTDTSIVMWSNSNANNYGYCSLPGVIPVLVLIPQCQTSPEWSYAHRRKQH